MAAEIEYANEGDEPLEIENDELYNSVAKMMDENKSCSNQRSKARIFKVPESLRKLKPSAYTPRVVSIGPLNGSDRRLKGMHEHKVSYMNSLFVRTFKSQDTLRQCVDAMLRMVPRARACYTEVFTCSRKVEFAKMMLLDDCFILELVFRVTTECNYSDDPILGNQLVLGGVIHDLLLLENQIPFFALEELFRLTLQKVHNRHLYSGIYYFVGSRKLSLTQFFLQFFSKIIIIEHRSTMTDGDHILGLLHNCYKPEGIENPGKHSVMKYSATQLQRAGVKFKPSKRLVEFQSPCLSRYFENLISWLLPRWCWFSLRRKEATPAGILLPVLVAVDKRNCCALYWLCQFCGRPSLEIPQLSLYDTTESILRNLIAFEQCSPNVQSYVTSYAFLMDTLVNSKEDVELLEEEGVLQNNLGVSEDAVDLFNSLCKEIYIAEFYFYNQWKQLNYHCNRYWPKHLASLTRTHFNTPWSFLKLIAAMLLFGLAAAQTTYTIKFYVFSLHRTKPN